MGRHFSAINSSVTVQAPEDQHIMTGVIGHMDPFNDADEQWTMYIDRFEHYILANDITAMLFIVMGPKMYGLLHSLVAPTKPGEMEYGCIGDVLQAHFVSKPLVIAERFTSGIREKGKQ